jgi:hypothetical protein
VETTCFVVSSFPIVFYLFINFGGFQIGSTIYDGVTWFLVSFWQEDPQRKFTDQVQFSEWLIGW